MRIQTLNTSKKTIEPVSQTQKLIEISSEDHKLKHGDIGDKRNLRLSKLSELIKDKGEDPLERCRWHG